MSDKIDLEVIRKEFKALAPSVASEAPNVFEAAVEEAREAPWRLVGQARELLDMEKLMAEINSYKLGGVNGPR